MKKVFLLLVILSLLVTPLVVAGDGENYFGNWTGNQTRLDYTIVSTTQTTVNPGIGDNIDFVTVINISFAGEGLTGNFTGFTFYLPDNRSTSTLTDFTFTNATGEQSPGDLHNASSFIEAYRNYVTFHLVKTYETSGNSTTNGTTFNLTWVMEAPITQTKIGSSLSGKRYTETWNITSLASNLSIWNASLVVNPTYWHTRIGDSTATTFNSTTKNYVATLSDLTVYTSLNMSKDSGLGLGIDAGSVNLLSFGSGWGTLSVSYDGTQPDASSGRSTSVIAEGVIPEETKKKIGLWLLIGVLGIFVIGGGALLAYFLKKPRY